jgi:hypothetical protein
MIYTDPERDAIHASAMAVAVNLQNYAGTLMAIENLFLFLGLTTVSRTDWRTFNFTTASSAMIRMNILMSEFISFSSALNVQRPSVPSKWIRSFSDPNTRGSAILLLFDTSYNPSIDGVYIDYFEILQPPVFSLGRLPDE